MEKDFLQFIAKCGGTTDTDVINKNKSRERGFAKKKKKESTYSKTLKLIEAGKTLDEIAFERDLALGTVISHLQYLKKNKPEIDLEHYKPEKRILDKVNKVVEQLKAQGNEEFLDKDGEVKLSPIFQAMNGQMDYETIRLAKLFV